MHDKEGQTMAASPNVVTPARILTEAIYRAWRSRSMILMCDNAEENWTDKFGSRKEVSGCFHCTQSIDKLCPSSIIAHSIYWRYNSTDIVD